MGVSGFVKGYNLKSELGLMGWMMNYIIQSYCDFKF